MSEMVECPEVGGLRRFICAYNPIYLLSSLSMLAGCVLVANDSEHTNVPLSQLLLLVGVLVVYQAALFLIGSFLMLRRGVLRDGRLLLILDAVFMADITFVNSELITTSLQTGLGIGMLLLGWAALRMHWIAARTGGDMPRWRYLFVLTAAGLIVLIPAYMKHIDDGLSVTLNTLYSMWWIGGLLLGGWVVTQHWADGNLPVAPRSERAAWVCPTYCTCAYASLLLHICVLHYVYNVAFVFALATPVLLALAMLLRRMEERWPIWQGTGVLRLSLLVCGTLFGLCAPGDLALHAGSVAISAVKLTLGGAYLALVFVYFRRYSRWLLSAGAAAAVLSVFGPSIQQTVEFIRMAMAATGRGVQAILPASRAGWGAFGIALSFILLGAGTFWSMRKGEQPESGGE